MVRSRSSRCGQSDERQEGLTRKGFKSKAAWDAWLENHHETSPGIWLEFAKKGRPPVLRVTHDADDGGWQFLCGTTDDPADGRIVGLGRMCDRDATLLELADLPEGWCAWRERPGAAWRRAPV